MHRVVILGGGFGGIATAVRLRALLPPEDEVVVVERRPTFVMGLRKNWGIAGVATLSAGTRRLAGLTRRGIDVRPGTLTGIDPTSRTVTVDDRRLTGDALVVALGAGHATARVPGLAEHALDVYDPASNAAAAAAVAEFRGGRLGIGIFGAPYPCPPAPFELALMLAERFALLGVAAEIEVFSPLPRSLPILGPAGCSVFESNLDAAGIAFLAGHVATAVEPGVVRFGEAARTYDLLLAVPPHRAPDVVVASGLTGGGDWVKVDPRTLETSHPGVWAIGDVTTIPLANGMALPKAGVFAHVQGEVVAERIADAFAGRESTAAFPGDGVCFLETGRGRASMVRGGFYADPPSVEMTAPSEDALAAKRAFETDRLTAWFGG